MTDNFNKARIAKNSILLYIRMLFTMWLNLYATRLVLKNLGVDDMGVYGVVGSVVGLFAVFSSGITSTIQRFITFELGKAERDVNKIFCSSLNIALQPRCTSRNVASKSPVYHGSATPRCSPTNSIKRWSFFWGSPFDRRCKSRIFSSSMPTMRS